MTIDLSDDERILLHTTADDKAAHADRCAERCSRPNRPDSVKAEVIRWQREANAWKSISAKLIQGEYRAKRA